MDSLHEEWRPVVGFEGQYEVSNLGRVRSLDRVIVRRDGVRMNVKGSVLRPTKVGGYHRVGFGCGPDAYIHRLVLEAFIGPCPVGMECCHWDGNHANNCLSNLRWDTRVSNLADRVRHGTSNRGERNGKAKLTASEARMVFDTTASPNDLARRLGVTARTIRRIRRGEMWKDLKATCEAAQ